VTPFSFAPAIVVVGELQKSFKRKNSSKKRDAIGASRASLAVVGVLILSAFSCFSVSLTCDTATSTPFFSLEKLWIWVIVAEDAFDAISIHKCVDGAAGACDFLVFWLGEGAEVGEWSGYMIVLDESASSALRNTGNGRMVYEPNTPELCLAIQEAGEHAREHARVRKARSGERCTYQKVPIETLSIFFAVKRRR